jgi:HupE/UreJ protein
MTTRPARIGRGFAGLFAALIALGAWNPPALRAHDFSITDTLALLKTNGTFQIDMTIDLDALAMNIPPKLHSPELTAEIQRMPEASRAQLLDTCRETLLNRVRIHFDEKAVVPLVSFPDYGTPIAAQAVAPTVFGVTARLVGRIPEGAKTFTFGVSPDAGIIHLTILDQGLAVGVKHILANSEECPPFRLDRPPSGASRGESESGVDVAARYLVLGFQHILPKGLDHILFVLGLFLLSTRLRPLLWQVTAFTVAHTLTLALAVNGVVELPSRVVESLIALSIAYVAVENLFTSELKPWRPALVFGFGLLHGLGFAGVLQELGLPRGEFVTSLIAFNVGVEAGQLTVICLALLTIGWFRRRAWYRRVIAIPISIGIALVGVYWAITRAVYGA